MSGIASSSDRRGREGEGASWRRLFGSGGEQQPGGDSTPPAYSQQQEAPTKKQREQLYKEAGLQFAEPEGGLKKRLAARLWGKDDNHSIHMKRVEQAHEAMMREQLAETEDMSARPEGLNPRGQASRSDAPPPDYEPPQGGREQ